jgi:hypothetical protein
MSWRLRVHAGPYRRHACPVVAVLPPGVDGPVRLFQLPGRRPRLAQLEPDPGGPRLHFLLHRLDAGKACDFLAEPADRRPPRGPWRWDLVTPTRWRLTDRGQPAGQYLADPTHPRPGPEQLVTPGGAEVLVDRLGTAAGLRGVPHHATRLEELIAPSAGPLLARIGHRAFWLGPRGEELAEELLTVAWWMMPPGQRLADVTLEVRAGLGPVAFAPAAGGLLALTAGLDLATAPALTVTAATGAVLPADGAPRRAAWCHLHAGPGVAVFDHPDNPGSPCGWRWSEAEGRCLADPLGGLTALPIGGRQVFRYRLWLHGDGVNRAAARRPFLDWTEPPRVEVLPA